MVLGIDPEVLPAALAGKLETDVVKSAIASRIDKRLARNGYLH
jgi:hypothetical protein